MNQLANDQSRTRTLSDRLRDIPMSEGERVRAEFYLRAGASLGDVVYRVSGRVASLAALVEEGARLLLRRVRSSIARPVHH